MPRETEPDQSLVPVIDTANLMAIQRAEIDGQIATAHAFPRKVTAFIREARELVSLDQETAEACIYSLPRGKDDSGSAKFITGPSVRFAEVIMHSYGNSRSGGRVVAQDEDWITAQGVFHDLEKNTMVTKEVRRRIRDKYGKKFNADMQGVTGNAAISLALRNAILAGIPQAIWLPIYESARMVAIGDVTTLVERRTLALAWFAKVGITVEKVLAKLDLAGVDDLGIEHLETLTGLKTAIRGGHVTPERAFEPEPGAEAKASTTAFAEKVAGARKEQANG